jgi:hypothetical protein
VETHQALKFRQLPGEYAVIRQDFDSPVPSWATNGDLVSITRTADELSIVCPVDHVPKEVATGLRWSCLKLEGPFPFSQTGVLLSFIEPLSSNAIPIFALSTYDTDYVLIPPEYIDRALDRLREAGHVRLTS